MGNSCSNCFQILQLEISISDIKKKKKKSYPVIYKLDSYQKEESI